MGSRDRDQRDLAFERIDVLEKLLTAALHYGLARCEELRSECVRYSIRVEDLIRRLGIEEKRVLQRDGEIERLKAELRRGGA